MPDINDAISKTRKGMGQLSKDAPEFMQSFRAMVDAVEKSGVIDAKTTELILVAIAVSKQCTYCIHLHVDLALKAGASREEILAAAQLAVVMGGGPALMYTVNTVVDCLDDLAG
ncbi:MAG: carboxymuconolactone decarboxylase family protein [Planctomycetes bacterium]|jgi:AhpD family alkylhydroperoxidase|nr:carboxymuconolactone decarboxylase family protein [Phycisphaerae bacterium]NBB95792.1 carboxymuconolactone decarboxylase family protein [Planctomycetota bacterium]